MSEMTDASEQGGLRPTSDDPLEKMPQAQRLRWLARTTHRAMAGSRRVQSDADWEKLFAEAHEEYDSGAFLLERLGAARYLDPKLMATLLKRLRRKRLPGKVQRLRTSPLTRRRLPSAQRSSTPRSFTRCSRRPSITSAPARPRMSRTWPSSRIGPG